MNQTLNLAVQLIRNIADDWVLDCKDLMTILRTWMQPTWMQLTVLQKDQLLNANNKRYLAEVAQSMPNYQRVGKACNPYLKTIFPRV